MNVPNATLDSLVDTLPELPSYTLTPLPPLLPPISDKILVVFAPVIAYWVWSLLFHLIDSYDLFPQYRLHTPAEVAKRNRVSRWEVLRDVITQQLVQIVVAYLLGLTEPDDFQGKEHYDIAVWARRIRLSQRILPSLLTVLGINAVKLGSQLAVNHPILAGLITGGRYSSFNIPKVEDAGLGALPTFAPWELYLAKCIFWVGFPALQYAVAIIFIDTWQYFLHRAMHMNKYLYTKLHSRHHRLYVPYAYGALYNHPVEGFILDTLGASIAYKLAGMNTRQGTYFFSFSSLKTVDDHCGYALPWDPLQHLSGNNAGYHDVHHQSWGIKTNFSQPYFTFWDRLLGTIWTGGDVSARYERTRLAAQKAADADLHHQTAPSPILNPITKSNILDSTKSRPEPYQNDLARATALKSVPTEYLRPLAPRGKAALQAAGSRQSVMEDGQTGGMSVLADEAREEKEAQAQLRRSPRKRATSSLSTRDGLKEISRRVGSNACMVGRAS